jgi:hypothetical protein
MAITFVSSGEQTTSNDGTPLTYTVDIGTRTNGLLLVFVGTIDTATHTHSTPTWNGTAMGLAASQISEMAASTFVRISMYYLSNPTNGSNTFSLAYSDGSTNAASVAYIVAAWFDGAHQTQASVLDQFDDNEGGSTDPSVAITPGTNNQLVAAFYASETNSVLTAAHNGIQDVDHGARVMGAQYVIQTTATTSTMSWSGTDDVWIGIGASFKEAAGGGGTTYNESPGGTVTSAGTVNKSTSKTFAGTVTSAGATLKSVGKVVAGTVTSAGAIIRSCGKSLSGTVTTAGTVSRAVTKSFAGTVTSAGAAIKATAKSFAGTVTSAGAIVTSFTFLKSVGGTVTSAGALVKSTGKSLAGTVTSSGSINRAISKFVSGVVSLVGSLIASLVGEEAYLLDVDLTDSVVNAATLSDSAVYAVSLSDSLVYAITLSDESRN